MSGRQKIYVDFSVRDPEGHLYVARLGDFTSVELGSTFVGTDFDEFEVECSVLAVDYAKGLLYHRPVDAAAVPGTSGEDDRAEAEAAEAVDASTVREPDLTLA